MPFQNMVLLAPSFEQEMFKVRNGPGRLLLLLSILSTYSVLSHSAGAQPASGVSPVQSEVGHIDFLYEDSRIYVPVRINDTAARWFILDTGASPTLVDKAVAANVGLATRGDRVTTGAGAGSSRQSDGEPVTLQLGGVQLEVAKPVVADLANLLGPTSGRAPAGIIGSQFFREHFVEIDFENRRISLYPPKVDRARFFDHAVPLSFTGGVPLAPVFLTLPSGQRVELNVLVDLGAKSTLLIPEPVIEARKLRDALPNHLIMGLGAGVGGDTRYSFARIGRIEFANAKEMRVEQPVVGLSVGGTLKSDWHQGLLGAEFLSRFRLGFDYAASKLRLTQVRSDRPVFDMSGMFLVAAGKSLQRIMIREVLDGSPARQAGLAPGDEIIALQDKPVQGMSLSAARDVLKSGNGTLVKVDYIRGSERLSANLHLRTLL